VEVKSNITAVRCDQVTVLFHFSSQVVSHSTFLLRCYLLARKLTTDQ